jgi:small-conductance mechanosensitive channel
MARALLIFLVFVASVAFAAEPDPPERVELEATAPVEVDGNTLFRVRGVGAYPAEKRAAAIAERIVAIARDRAFPTGLLRVVETELGASVMAGDQRLVVVTDTDARVEAANRTDLARVLAGRIGEAIDDYRRARTREALTRTAILVAVATAVLLVAIAVIALGVRRLRAVLEARYRHRIKTLGIGSFELLRADRVWAGVSSALRFARTALVLLAVLLYAQQVLGLLPATRGAAKHVTDYVLAPVGTMASGIVGTIPDLLFLAVLFVVVRFALKLVGLYFGGLARGDVMISGFDREWAEPTYKLARLGIIALALVVAYPYIPGSSSDAFKGVSLFIGVLFSLGSSSAIANIVAGYMMTYRRAFKVGDRVKIGDVTGDVTQVRLQVTHLKTVKNEDVIIPNSTILGSEVVNYSSLAQTKGLILHTTVGIGYETPWRQVEAMLVLAAQRTPGFLAEPAPFVLQKALGDFAITYELNAYCREPQQMAALYTDMHRNILDVFNEYGVQIMTPAYEGDPDQPKIVPKDRWTVSPADTKP